LVRPTKFSFQKNIFAGSSTKPAAAPSHCAPQDIWEEGVQGRKWAGGRIVLCPQILFLSADLSTGTAPLACPNGFCRQIGSPSDLNFGRETTTEIAASDEALVIIRRAGSLCVCILSIFCSWLVLCAACRPLASLWGKQMLAALPCNSARRVCHGRRRKRQVP
jgi:hypothetical protein